MSSAFDTSLNKLNCAVRKRNINLRYSYVISVKTCSHENAFCVVKQDLLITVADLRQRHEHGINILQLLEGGVIDM